MITSNAEKVLKKRYLLKNDSGAIIETPKGLFARVAKYVANGYEENTILPELFRKTELEKLFYESMINGYWLPNTPCLMNAGKPDGQLSACFVLPVEDSMEGIFDAIKWAAIIHKTGGGTGFSFSRLRPKNSTVKSTHGIASGPVSFMKVFNAATEAVKQGGSRRGANMGILHIDHPDILEFIRCKKDLTQVTNFNISVAITEKFMEAVEKNINWYFRDPKTGQLNHAAIPAQELFDEIVELAWTSGEPGLIFIDEINRRNPGNKYETIEATNPCGEIPLPPFDVCNLLSINLGTHIKDDGSFDFLLLEKNARLATIFLDSMINVNHFPIPQIQEQVLKSRRLGLGVMGFADALIKLGIPYDSNLALEFADNIMSSIKKIGDETSRELGRAFGYVYDLKRRNTTITMIAPTGTISIIAGCSSGIEPIYSVAFTRNVMEGTRMTEVNPEFEKIAKDRGFYSNELMEKIANSNSIQNITEIPEDVRTIFKTAADVSPEMHIKMQAVFQKHCDSAVSKTINLSENSSIEDVKNAYLLAYRLGCKGVTVYRDGSRPGQVLSTGATPESARNTEQVGAFGNSLNMITPAAEKPSNNKLYMSTTLPRPDRLNGYTEKIKTGYGNLYVTINSFNNKPFEVFASIGKSGFSMMADTEAICRMISLALRNNICIDEITEQLQGIGGSQTIIGKNGTVYSIADAIAKILKGYNGEENSIIKNTHFDISKEKCPDCSNDLSHSEGCVKCLDCGFSKC